MLLRSRVQNSNGSNCHLIGDIKAHTHIIFFHGILFDVAGMSMPPPEKYFKTQYGGKKKVPVNKYPWREQQY